MATRALPARGQTGPESKPKGTSVCQGYNGTNGQPCRNIISATRVFPYCHQHQAQRQQLKPDPPYPVDHNLNHDGIRSAQNWSHESSVPSRSKSPPLHLPGAYPIEVLQSTSIPVTPPVFPVESNKAARQSLTMPGRADTADQSRLHVSTSNAPISKEVKSEGSKVSLRDSRPTEHHKNRFNFAKFLVSLGCMPSTTTRSKIQDISKNQIRPASMFSEASSSDEKKDVKRIPRKPVDMRTKQQIEQELRIKQDRAEIERLISPGIIAVDVAKSSEKCIAVSADVSRDAIVKHAPIPDMVGKVRSDLRPYRAPDFVRYKMTKHQQDAYYLERYANLMDYPHKSNKGMARMQEVVRSIVNAALMASYTEADSHVWEYVYVFRLDGDYTNTPRISLKIGRSKDVNARLKQWFAQCRYRIDKLEQFETQHAVLLERMMHLEFEEDRILKQCRCGHTHREWFDIRREDARGRIRRAYTKWASFADEIQALRSIDKHPRREQ